MDEQFIEGLLARPSEDTSIDFKSKEYRLHNDHFKAKFVKDILSLANTPRIGSAYIVLGVRLSTNGDKEVLGVSQHPDDAELQNLVASKTLPVPSFVYRPISFKGVTLGVIEIEPRRPGSSYVSNWEKPGVQSGLKYGVTYFRRGSSNSEAGPGDLERINQWMLGPEDSLGASPRVEVTDHYWDEFFEVVHRFEGSRLYVLILGASTTTGSDVLSALGRIPWSIVFDFDSKTDSEGAFRAAKSDLENLRAVHLLTFDDIVPFYPERATYWIAANGLADRPSTTLEQGGWQAWNRKYARKLNEVVERFARSAGPNPVTIVIASDHLEETRIICQQLDGAFGQAAQFVFTGSDESLSNLSASFGSSPVPMSLRNVCSGLLKFLPGKSVSSKEASLPTTNGGQISVVTEQMLWLEEELEVVHSNIGVRNTEDEDDWEGNFLKGSAATWFDFSMHFDVERDKLKSLKNEMETSLRGRSPRVIHLRHWPGAGGSTLARRLAWDLHLNYPVVRLRSGSSQHTVNRLRTVADITGSPVLILAEAADVPAGTVERLHAEASANRLPLVFLSVQRDFGSASEGDRVVHLGRTLSNVETYRFTERLSLQVPARRIALQRLSERGRPHERTPFYLALVAFDRDFVNLETYVKYRLDTLTTNVQKEILAYLALAYHYAQRSLSGQMFTGLLGIPPYRTVDLDNVLPGSVVGDLIIREGHNRWRPIHDLVAEEIIRQILAGNETDFRVWNQNASSWSRQLARFFENQPGIPTDETMDLLRRIFVIRDDQQILGTEQSGQPTYARLIEDIPSEEGRLVVLQELVSLFPDEPHFWAHLGRFSSLSLKDHDSAIDALRRALELTPQDNILHHMLGMAIRAKAYNIVESSPNRNGELNKLTEQLALLEREAGAEFELSRSLAPLDEHGYISHIQLMIRCVEAGFRASGSRIYEEFLLSSSAVWYRDLIDASETLLEELARLKIGQDNLGRYYVQCRTSLDRLYGDYTRVIERWTNLIGRQGVYQPPVRRQIVRAYLARQGREWHQLKEIELSRIIDLLEANILDEPRRASNLRLWFQAVRNSSVRSIDEVIERLSYWWADASTLDAGFYLGIAHVLKALDGSRLSGQKAIELIEQTSRMVRENPDRHFSSEWLGKGDGLRRILPYHVLGRWDEEFREGSQLALIKGRVASIRRPEQGWIELDFSLRAFFVPSHGYEGDTFLADRDENEPVEFYLAFSYDGPVAWSVRRPISSHVGTLD